MTAASIYISKIRQKLEIAKDSYDFDTLYNTSINLLEIIEDDIKDYESDRIVEELMGAAKTSK